MCPCELLSAAITLAECKQSKDKMTHSRLPLDSSIFNFLKEFGVYIFRRKMSRPGTDHFPVETVSGRDLGPSGRDLLQSDSYLFILSGRQINQQPGPCDAHSLNDLWSLKASRDHVIKCNCRGLPFSSANGCHEFIRSRVCAQPRPVKCLNCRPVCRPDTASNHSALFSCSSISK